MMSLTTLTHKTCLTATVTPALFYRWPRNGAQNLRYMTFANNMYVCYLDLHTRLQLYLHKSPPFFLSVFTSFYNNNLCFMQKQHHYDER